MVDAKMRIALNFIPLKSGGGVQVGLDLLAQIQQSSDNHEWLLVGTEGTPFLDPKVLGRVLLAGCVSNKFLDRLWFEYVGCRSLLRDIRPDLVYTLFGGHWPGAKIPHVIGCAYSNLMYPEIKFWDSYPFAKRLVRELVDWERRRRLTRASHVIFETEDLAARAIRYLGLRSEAVHVVRPSVSTLVRPGQHHPETAERCRLLPKGYRVLLISGFQPNKNFALLPKIAQVLKQEYGAADYVFVTTLPVDHPGTRAYLADATGRDVASMIYNFGPVAHAGCAELYSAIDCVILPSRLESFSNTIAEAWSMERPLLISDLDWAHALCGEGAVYIDQNDARHVAHALLKLREDDQYGRQVVARGSLALSSYPTSSDRFRSTLQILEKVSGACG